MQRIEQGEFTWVDLLARHLDVQSEFYRGLFDWTWTDIGEGSQRYRMFSKDGGSVAGGSVMPPEMEAAGHPSAWNAYIAVDDLDAALARAVELGGRTVIGPADAMDTGRYAGIADPTGGEVMLMEVAQADPTARYAEPGSLAMASLATREPQTAADFYERLVGYGVTRTDDGPIPYWQLDVAGRGAGGIMPMPEAMPDEVPPAWVVFFAVEDAAASADRATELGGRVLGEPTEVRGRLIFVPVVDPLGATFQLLQPLGR